MRTLYNKNTKLDFGLYKGYELGIVYVFDPCYIEWCMNNIENFRITDLNELKEYSIINEKLDWEYRMIGDPSLIPNIDDYDTFKKLIDNVDLGNKKFEFNHNTLQNNETRLDINKPRKWSAADYFEDLSSWDSNEDFNYFTSDNNSWGTDGGCGEGYSCNECDNIGCPAHPLN